MTEHPLLEITNMSVRFRGGELGKAGLTAVDRASLSIGRGEVVALVGESGCGKSTLARAVVRLEQPESGSIKYAGRDIASLAGQQRREFRRGVSFIFQDPLSSLSPRQTVGEAIEEPLVVHGVGDRRARAARILELLDLVGGEAEWAERYPRELSGGQRQRVAIARSLALDPQLLVCDEPLTALDVSTQAQIVTLFTVLRERLGLAYLFIGHDLTAVRRIADRVAVMHLGQIVELGPGQSVLGEPAHPYTRALVDSIPVADPVVQRERIRLVLRGELPSPLDPPSGCRFRTRCPHAFDRCTREEPLLRVVLGEDHHAACHLWDRSDAMAVVSSPTRAEVSGPAQHQATNASPESFVDPAKSLAVHDEPRINLLKSVAGDGQVIAT